MSSLSDMAAQMEESARERGQFAKTIKDGDKLVRQVQGYLHALLTAAQSSDPQLAQAAQEAIDQLRSAVAIPQEATIASVGSTDQEAPEQASVKLPTTEKPKKVNQFGAGPIAYPIIKAAFVTADTIPDSLEEAIKLAFGEDWETKVLSKAGTGGKQQRVSFAQDLRSPNSTIQTSLTNALEKLNRVAAQDGTPVKALQYLYDRLVNNGRIANIGASINQWIGNAKRQVQAA